MLCREKGLTLVEILVALAILTIVLGTAINLYLQGVFSWQRQDHFLEAQDNLRIAADRLVRELRQAQRLDGASSSSRAIFYLLYPENNNTLTEQRVYYYLQGNVLYREWKGVANPVASHITGFSLEYAPASEPSISKRNLVTITLSGQVKNGKETVLQTKVRLRRVKT